MTIALLNGFINGNFFTDGKELLKNSWGIVSVVDLYVGFIIFSMWVYFREDSKITSILWIIVIMILGFFSISIYVLIELHKSNDNWLDFFLKDKKTKILNELNNK